MARAPRDPHPARSALTPRSGLRSGLLVRAAEEIETPDASATPQGSATIARLLALAPAALVVFLSFHAGGFFPGATGIAAALVAIVVVV
ncbi:MAG: hypothetical protein QOJ12_259, partial [Thermoleophilales bacterium]|nr:hypothetical protein [Thermoleophilales bacterium]